MVSADFRSQKIDSFDSNQYIEVEVFQMAAAVQGVRWPIGAAGRLAGIS